MTKNRQQIRLLAGDCVDRLAELPDESICAVITDPPYDLTSSGGGGFMGKEWDATGIAFDPQFWKLVQRKLKPGGVVKSFGGTRTYHRMVRAMREAGLVVESIHAWIYSSGFPKSHQVSPQIDKFFKAERQIVGYKQGVGGEDMNDIVRGRSNVRFTAKSGGALGAYGQGAKQVAVQVPITAPSTELAKLWDGYGTAVKPAWEPIVIARRKS